MPASPAVSNPVCGIAVVFVVVGNIGCVLDGGAVVVVDDVCAAATPLAAPNVSAIAAVTIASIPRARRMLRVLPTSTTASQASDGG